jgi:predicted choloylglycine hydrolase
MKLEGNSYEIGRTLGNIYGSIPGFVEGFRLKEGNLSKHDEEQMLQMFDEFCPGINEEVSGFADAVKIPASQVLYYMSTYLRPGCSQMALLPSRLKTGISWWQEIMNSVIVWKSYY